MGWLYVNPREGTPFIKDEAMLNHLLDSSAIKIADTKATVHVWQSSVPLLDSDKHSLDVFCKVYDYPRPNWRFFGRRSKARRELRNAQAFNRFGIRTADVLACGEQRDMLGRLRRAFIITRTIPEAFMLDEYARRLTESGQGQEATWKRRSLVRQLATMVATLHRHDFFHNDLHWRNVLVTETPGDCPSIWFIDCPRGRFRRWSSIKLHYRIKDLATLDRTAKELCTLRERIRFARMYLGALESNQPLRRLLAHVERYRSRRWPE